MTEHDAVNHPSHYTSHPSGIECIDVTEHMGFNLGNAVKYIWRADLKGAAVEDLEKARWYLDREITKRVDTEGEQPVGDAPEADEQPEAVPVTGSHHTARPAPSTRGRGRISVGFQAPEETR